MNVQRVSKTEINESFLQSTLEESGIERHELPENLTEALIIYIARVSSSRDNKWEDYTGLINFLVREGHWSPFEHAFITYEIETSRAIGRQLIRHRSFTFQEFSQRYAEARTFEDVELRGQPEQNRQSSSEPVNPDVPNPINQIEMNSADRVVDATLEMIRSIYNNLLSAGVASETARMILPECTQTTIYMTGSLRSWIHFLDLRLSENSQKEIRLIGQDIAEDLSSEFPHVAKARGFK